MLSSAGGVAAARRGSLSVAPQPAPGESICVYDSSAYFIRDVTTGREVLMFGDVEPDSISLSPRNGLIWQEAAPKIAAGNLAAVFLECSYDDSQPLDRLYGHLTPRFVVEEMMNLAAEVTHARIAFQQQKAELQEQQKLQQRDRDRDRDGRKRKRYAGDDDRMSISNTSRTTSHSRRKTEALLAATDESTTTTIETADTSHLSEDPVSPRTVRPVRMAIASSPEGSGVRAPASAASEEKSDGPQSDTPHLATPTEHLSLIELDVSRTSADAPADRNAQALAPRAPSPEPELPLHGLKVVIIHVKEKLRDGPTAGEIILDQLREYEERNPLGCEYIISYAGQSLYF